MRLLGDYAPDAEGRGEGGSGAAREGSIGRALELAGAGSLELYREMVDVLATLPELDMARLHGFAERFAAPRRGGQCRLALAQLPVRRLAEGPGAARRRWAEKRHPSCRRRAACRRVCWRRPALIAGWRRGKRSPDLLSRADARQSRPQADGARRASWSSNRRCAEAANSPEFSVMSGRSTLLRHHADLLRERRAPYRARLHDARLRRAGPLHAARRPRRALPDRHRRARPEGREGGGGRRAGAAGLHRQGERSRSATSSRR